MHFFRLRNQNNGIDYIDGYFAMVYSSGNNNSITVWSRASCVPNIESMVNGIWYNCGFFSQLNEALKRLYVSIQELQPRIYRYMSKKLGHGCTQLIWWDLIIFFVYVVFQVLSSSPRDEERRNNSLGDNRNFQFLPDAFKYSRSQKSSSPTAIQAKKKLVNETRLRCILRHSVVIRISMRTPHNHKNKIVFSNDPNNRFWNSDWPTQLLIIMCLLWCALKLCKERSRLFIFFLRILHAFINRYILCLITCSHTFSNWICLFTIIHF